MPTIPTKVQSANGERSFYAVSFALFHDGREDPTYDGLKTADDAAALAAELLLAGAHEIQIVRVVDVVS